jgi:3'(2'), 5'-bisphosphate nucleotidase
VTKLFDLSFYFLNNCVKKELYFALEGLGSFKTLNFTDEITDLEKLISVSDTLPIKQERNTYIIVGSRSHMSEETEQFFNEKRKENDKVDVLAVGSSLKLCMVAEGKADAYPRYAPTMEWDTGAGDAICRMAGFQVLQYNTENPVEYNKENLLNPWFLVK